jgi:hypothetical protein
LRKYLGGKSETQQGANNKDSNPFHRLPPERLFKTGGIILRYKTAHRKKVGKQTWEFFLLLLAFSLVLSCCFSAVIFREKSRKREHGLGH